MNATHHGGYHAHTSRPAARGGYLPDLVLVDQGYVPEYRDCVFDAFGRVLNSPCQLNSSGYDTPIATMSPLAYLGQHLQGGVATVGGLSTTAADVHNAKVALDSQYVVTNRQWELVSLGNAQNNPQFSAAAANDYPSWDSVYQAWNAFVLEDSSFLGADDDMARVNDYAAQLKTWQANLQKDAGVTPLAPATPPSHPDNKSTDPLGINDTLTTVAWIAGFIVVGILAIEVAPALLPHHRRYA